MLEQDRRQDLDNSIPYLHPYSSLHPSESHLQTRPFSERHHQSSSLSPFAQFLKEDDERFFATFPDAARAAQEQQQHQQWSMSTLTGGYGDFYGSTAFLSYDGSRNYAPSISEPSPSVIDAPYTHDVYSNESISCSYPLDVSGPTGLVPPYAYSDPVSPDAAPSHDFNAAYYGPMQTQMTQAQISIDDTIVHPEHQFPESSPISPVHPSAHFITPGHSDPPPIMDFLPSPEPTDTVFSAPDHQLCSVSPEYMASASPETPTLPPYPIAPPSESPDSMMPPRELSLSTQSLPDSEPSPSDPADVLGESSSPPEGTLPKIPAKGRRRNRSADFQGPSSSEGPRSYMYKIPLQKPAPSPAPKVPKPRATAAPGEKKSLALACFFCRGRKIACGPQDPNSSDRTCNQCHRRSLKCEYPTESRRGMRKRKSNNPPDPDFEAHGPKVPIPSMMKD